jgi:uncharacterized protein YeaO (DUF488 family)
MSRAAGTRGDLHEAVGQETTPPAYLLERRSEAECETLPTESDAAAHEADTPPVAGKELPMPQQSRVRAGRVYDERMTTDGTRVLVDALWPRGLTKQRADIDEWCTQIAPSANLRKWYGHDPRRFAEFARRYRAELADPERAACLLHLRELARHAPLTLLTATRDLDISQAVVLTDLLNAEELAD